MLNAAIKWYLKGRMNRLNKMAEHPVETQSKVFQYLIRTAKDTGWGKKFGYASIHAVEEFKKRVPLGEYEQIKPYIIRIQQGEQNLLWPTDIRWFAKSSGTTGDASKFIPVSQEALRDCHYRGGMDIFSVYCSQNPKTKMFCGKSLSIGGSHRINDFNDRSRYGDISAVLIQNMPWWAEIRRSPARKIALMDEWESKLEQIARTSVKQNITSMAGVPSWTLVLLKKILNMTGKKNIHEVWPNLELFVHGAVSFTPYKAQYESILPGKNMHYLETYNASEGFFAFQDKPGSPEMLLMLDHGIFYEFLPLDELGKPHPVTKSLEETETDKNYAIIISTNAGLWRYMIGDTVKFTSIAPYRIAITGRTRHFINAFGEEVIIDNAEKAIAEACRKTAASVKEYTAAPVYMKQNETGAHEWLIEFETPPVDRAQFISVLDETLKKVNTDYEAKRYKDIALRKPIVTFVPAGTFHNWLKLKNKLGGQHKVPRLSNDRVYVEEILKMLGEKSD